MRAGQTLDFPVLRRRQTELALATDIAGLPGAGQIAAATIPTAAAAYLAYAEQQGFTLGRGAGTVALLAAQFGIGFLHDAAYPQLAATFRDDISGDEAYRLALIRQWADWHISRAAHPSPAVLMQRLRRLAALMTAQGMSVLAEDPHQLYTAIDHAKAAMGDGEHWRKVALQWHEYLLPRFAVAQQLQLDYGRTRAFCLGQYFALDPLWARFGDLRPEGIFAFQD